MEHIKFPKIRDYATFVKNVTRNRVETIDIVGKIKLHGTNCSVVCTDDGPVAQSRNRVLSLDDDHLEFAAWVDEFRAFWRYNTSGAVVYGEWAGPGIVAKQDAVGLLDRRYFFVFAIRISEHEWITKSDAIHNYLIQNHGIGWPDSLRVLPTIIEFNQVSTEKLDAFQTIADTVNDAVNAIENVDPYIKEQFGVEYRGEGIVFMPADGTIGKDGFPFSNWCFKAKTNHHRVKISDKAAKIQMALPATVHQFVKDFTTVPRMEQGVAEVCQGEYDKRNMGKLIKWVQLDIFVESDDERAELNVDWKKIAGLIAKEVVAWYSQECEKI